MKKLIIGLLLVATNLLALEINDFINKDYCGSTNIIVDKEIYKVCYSTKMKGPLYVGYSLDGKLVDKGNFKKRPAFYTEKNIPKKYRVTPSDFTYTGTQRGHMANHASFDNEKNIKRVKKTYSMVNISPQYPQVNFPIWSKSEQAERSHAKRLGTLNVMNIIIYEDKKNYLHRIPIEQAMKQNPNKKSSNGMWTNKKIKKYNKSAKKLLSKKIVIPTKYVKILWNDNKNFMKCYLFENNINAIAEGDKLKDHLVDCKKYLP